MAVAVFVLVGLLGSSAAAQVPDRDAEGRIGGPVEPDPGVAEQVPLGEVVVPVAVSAPLEEQPIYRVPPAPVSEPVVVEATARRGAAPERVAATPVSVALPSDAAEAAIGVRAEVLSDARARGLGVNGPALRLARSDATRAGLTDVVVQLDYSDWADAYGGLWADRLMVLWFGDCESSDREACEPRVLPAVRDADGQTMRVTVPVASRGQDPPAATDTTSPAPETAANEEEPQPPGEPEGPEPSEEPSGPEPGEDEGSSQVLALTAGPSGDNGTFTATPMGPYGEWAVGLSSGSFSWSYPVPVPATPTAPLVELSLAYSSGSVDGLTAEANAQPGFVGLGWELAGTGFIERRYRSCSDDGGSALDLCWPGAEYLTVSLGGLTEELVATSDPNTFRVKRDPNWLVQRFYGASNGDNDGEHWLVRTPDGTEHWFGRGLEPSTGIPTGSAWVVPVRGNNPGEPCSPSWCQQAWRWTLDGVVDRNGNATTLYWAQEVNHYGFGGAPNDLQPYVRGGHLLFVGYGKRAGAEGATTGRVLVEVADRCLQGSSCPVPGPSQAASYPDVPVDLLCSAAPCTNHVPTFFTTKRLVSLSSDLAVGAGWDNVDKITLTHELPDNGFDERKLWLRTVQRTGASGPSGVLGGPSSLTLPPVRFDSLLSGLANRANPGGGVTPAVHFRIDRINNELGGLLDITYGQPHPCVPIPTGNWDTNTKDCFPAWASPSGGPAGFATFNKWLTMSVTQSDPVTTSPAVTTTYAYEDTPAWHHLDDPVVPDARQSWSEWRGHSTVLTTTDPTGARERTRYRFMRGMFGDRLVGGGSKTDTIASLEPGSTVSVQDADFFVGHLLDMARYETGGAERWGQLVTPVFVQTSTSGTGAFWRGPEVTRTRQRGPGGVLRKHQSSVTYDTATLVPRTSTDAIAVPEGTESFVPQRCTSTSYAQNPPTHRLVFPAEVRVHGTSCAGAVLSHRQLRYDNQPVGTLGTGPANLTHDRRLATAAPAVWLEERLTYDPLGRVLQRFDPSNHLTTTAYAPASGLAVTVTVTNPALHVSTTTFENERQQPIQIVDPNANVAKREYDALGRLVRIDLPNPSNGAQAVPGWQFAYGVDPAKATPSIAHTIQYATPGRSAALELPGQLGTRAPEPTPRTSCPRRAHPEHDDLRRARAGAMGLY